MRKNELQDEFNRIGEMVGGQRDMLGMGYRLDIRCHSEYFAETVLYA